MNVETGNEAKRIPFFTLIKKKILHSFRLTDNITVKLYTGYGNETDCILYGHVLSLAPYPRKNYRKIFLINALSLLRLFMVKPVAGALLQFTWENKTYETTTEKDGFFKFEWKPSAALTSGNHKVEVHLIHPENKSIIASAVATILVPYYNQYAFVSDIDDTFLVSHSANLRKRLYVLFTENAKSRRPFEGVVNHYQLLANANEKGENSNPFFYVSSSEWNLYDYIRDFAAHNNLPAGVFLLNQLKTFSQVFKTGQNNHKTKFMRISRVMEAYPRLRFVLLGDDSQEDPFIYASLAEHFKERVFCVYIRCVGNERKLLVEEKIKSIETSAIPCCYFMHSAEAAAHSVKIGLIPHV